MKQKCNDEKTKTKRINVSRCTSKKIVKLQSLQIPLAIQIKTHLCSIQCFGGEVVERRHSNSVLPTKPIRPNCEPKYTKGTRKGGYNILRELHSS